MTRSTTTALLELWLPAIPSSIRDARVAAGEVVTELGGSERLVDDVRLCVSEAVTNAVRHAYEAVPGAAQICLWREDDELESSRP